MAAIGVKIDHTANLPDELLHQVFSYLPLRGKLRVESVSRRFQRCVLELMKREPHPLELKIDAQLLNDYSIQSGTVFDALRSLAKKAKFSKVNVRTRWTTQSADQKGCVNTLLIILLESDSLDKVVSFECDCGPSQDILEKVIAKCVKLSTVTLGFTVHPPPNTQLWTPVDGVDLDHSTALDLNQVLYAKALTQLELRLTAYHQEQLVELFHSIRPQTLQKLTLTFCYEMPTLDLAAMVKQLNTNAWAALKEMNLCWETSARMHLANFFQSLSLLPALEKCDVRLCDEDIQSTNHLVATLTALFNSDKKITMSSEDGFLGRGNMSDCQVMAKILQLQKVHPSVGVDFYLNHDYYALFLTLSNGTGLFKEEATPQSCGDVHCVDCHRFYPAVFSALEDVADDAGEDSHLDHYQLDKCRVDTVVERLNYEGLEAEWRALTAETNDTGDLATISFETIEDDEDEPPEHFEITVACGPCFSSSCIRCVNVD